MTTELRNKEGQRSIVTPRTAADPDIEAHGGKVVICLEYGPAYGPGGAGWYTFPCLRDAYNNRIAWDDRDLTPLGDGAEATQAANELEHA